MLGYTSTGLTMSSSRAHRVGPLICASIVLMATTACDLGIASLGSFNIDGPVCDASCYDFSFLLTPEAENILQGDSLELSVFSSRGLKATWASSGDAIAMILGDGSLDSTITTAQSDTWIRAVRAGTGIACFMTLSTIHLRPASRQVTGFTIVTIFGIVILRNDTASEAGL